MPFLLGCYVFDGEHFQHLPCADFSVAKLCDEDHNCWFSNPYCGAQFTCVEAVIPNQCMNIVCGLHHCCSAWLASVGPSPLYFSLLSKLWTCLINFLPFVASSPHTLFRHLWIPMVLVTSAVINSITTTQCLVCMSTAFVMLHCYFVECMSLTGALMILLEMNSVTIQWVRQGTLIVPHLKEEKWRHCFRTDPHVCHYAQKNVIFVTCYCWS